MKKDWAVLAATAPGHLIPGILGNYARMVSERLTDRGRRTAGGEGTMGRGMPWN